MILSRLDARALAMSLAAIFFAADLLLSINVLAVAEKIQTMLAGAVFVFRPMRVWGASHDSTIGPLGGKGAVTHKGDLKLIVRLLAAASMADDRIAFISGASPQNDLGASRGPIRFELVRRGGKWHKKNRSLWGSARALTCQDLSRKRSSSS